MPIVPRRTLTQVTTIVFTAISSGWRGRRLLYKGYTVQTLSALALLVLAGFILVLIVWGAMAIRDKCMKRWPGNTDAVTAGVVGAIVLALVFGYCNRERRHDQDADPYEEAR